MYRSTMNQLGNIRNPYQGISDRVLCVCSAGLLRSPSMTVVLQAEPFNKNCRAAGTEDYALVRISEALIKWADQIVVADSYTEQRVRQICEELGIDDSLEDIINLNIPDQYGYRDGELLELIKKRYVGETTGDYGCA